MFFGIVPVKVWFKALVSGAYIPASKLVSMKEEENKKNTNELKGDERKIEWGSQIRSYVFCPYKLVKDNRTNYETSNLDDVMNGDLDNFVFEYLKSI